MSPATEFDQFADDYHEALEQGLRASGEDAAFFAQRRIRFLHACLSEFGFHPRTVLDYGCGVGTAVPLLMEILKPERIIGVDVSEQSLEVARERYQDLPVEFIHNDAFLEAGTIDLAYCNGVFHHIPVKDRERSMHYVEQRLRPDGLFSLWENNPWNPGTRYVMSKIPFDRDAIMLSSGEVNRLGKSASMTSLRTDFCFFFPRSLAWFRGLERSLVKLPLGAQYQVLFQRAG